MCRGRHSPCKCSLTLSRGKEEQIICSTEVEPKAIKELPLCVSCNICRRRQCQSLQGLSSHRDFLVKSAPPLLHSPFLEVRPAASCRSLRKCDLTWMKSKDFVFSSIHLLVPFIKISFIYYGRVHYL